MSQNYDRQQIHRHRTGDDADRKVMTPLEGELLITTDGASPVAFIGDGTSAGGFLVGPFGGINCIEKLNQDLGPAAAINWTAHPIQTEGFVHSTSVNPSEIGFTDGGLFLIKCSCTVLFAGTTDFILQIQRDQSTGTWKNINGGGGIISKTAGQYGSVTVSRQYAFPDTEKVRVIGSNSLATLLNTSLVKNYCSFEVVRIR